jgi:hypothetical protein
MWRAIRRLLTGRSGIVSIDGDLEKTLLQVSWR